MARILIVDDDDQVRAVIREWLEGDEYEVVEAPDGRLGTKLYRENPFDLVILDMIMPEKEGLETIIELLKSYPDAKIIAISGGGRVASEPYLETAQKLGALCTLAKPIEKEDLLNAVLRHKSISNFT